MLSDSCSLSVVKDMICYNQGALISYLTQMVDLRKNMAEELEKPKNLAGIKKAYDRLVDFSERQTTKITKKNFDFITSFFKKRENGDAVRLCIKLNSKDGFITLLRGGNNHNFNTAPVKVTESSPFRHCIITEKYYLCNDIPKYSKAGEYINPRLDNEKLKNLDLDSDSFADEWIKCWRPYQGGKKIEEGSAYQSTLIVPIALKRKRLDKSTQKRFELSKPEYKDINQIIWGFLSFDHIKTDFFQKNDVDFGYIAADILSPYFVIKSSFTIFSETFRRAKRRVNNDG